MAKVSKNIKKFRTDNGLTQDALAEKINVTRQTVSSWENGRTQPDIEMLEILSQVFSVGIEEPADIINQIEQAIHTAFVR